MNDKLYYTHRKLPQVLLGVFIIEPVLCLNVTQDIQSTKPEFCKFEV